MSGLSNLWSKFARSKKYREAFVASQLKRGIPTQMRVLLKQRGWSQADLAERSGLTQGAISRATDPDYGNLTFNNVLKIASGYDIAFVGKFVPFSELASWYDSITDEEKLMVDSFDEDAEPQTRETSFEAALAAHAAMPATLGEYADIAPPIHPDLLADAGHALQNNLAGALTYSGAEPAFYRDMAGAGNSARGGFIWQGNLVSGSSEVPPQPESLGVYKKPAGIHLVPKHRQQSIIAPINDPKTKIA